MLDHPPTDRERLEAIGAIACDLLVALQPWGMQTPAIRSAATRLTVSLAAIPSELEPLFVVAVVPRLDGDDSVEMQTGNFEVALDAALERMVDDGLIRSYEVTPHA